MRSLFLVSVAALLWTGAARAETAPPMDIGCFGVEIALPPNVPANLPGIPLRGATSATTASLLAADGTVIPTTLKFDPLGTGSILAIDGELVPGETYTIRWTDDCDGIRTQSFLAVEPAPLPTEAGTITAAPQSTGGFAGECDERDRPYLALHRSITFQPSPEMSRFMNVTGGELLLRGGPPRTAFATGSKPGPVVAMIEHQCPAEPTTYYASMRLTIADGPALVTPEIPVLFVCPNQAPRTCGVDPYAPVDAGAPDTGAAAEPTNENDTVRAGCASSGHAASSVELTFAALALVLAARRRKP